MAHWTYRRAADINWEEFSMASPFLNLYFEMRMVASLADGGPYDIRLIDGIGPSRSRRDFSTVEVVWYSVPNCDYDETAGLMEVFVRRTTTRELFTGSSLLEESTSACSANYSLVKFCREVSLAVLKSFDEDLSMVQGWDCNSYDTFAAVGVA